MAMGFIPGSRWSEQCGHWTATNKLKDSLHNVKIDPKDSGPQYLEFEDIVRALLDAMRNTHLSLSRDDLPGALTMLADAGTSHDLLYAMLKSHPRGAEVAGHCLLNVIGDRIEALRALALELSTSSDRPKDVRAFLLRRLASDPPAKSD